MFEILGEVISGLIVNGVTSLSTQAWHHRDDAKKNLQVLNPKLAADPDLRRLLTVLERDVRAAGGDEGATLEALRTFLSQSEARTIARQLVSMALQAGAGPRPDVGPICDEFLAIVAANGALAPLQSKALATALTQILDSAARQVVHLALQSDVVSPAEIATAADNWRLEDEIRSIKINIEFLASQARRPSAPDWLEYDKKYRTQVANSFRTITPPNFESDQKFPIDSIYVSPSFRSTLKSTQAKPAPMRRRILEESISSGSIGIPRLVSDSHRTVVLGNPGAGKSTLVAKIAHDFSTGRLKTLDPNWNPTPLVVVVRDYGSAKKESHLSVVQFLAARACSNLQLDVPPAGFFEYLLLNGRAIVFFDGLDELVDSSDRRDVSSAIESFCNLYPNVPVVVTSRQVGYELAPLDSRRFECFELVPFNDRQIREYAKKWFAMDTELTPEQRASKTSSFVRESESIADLRSNPLMLGLLCNIYRVENYIPQYRHVVYRKCAEMLFERWDKGRGILVRLPFEQHIDPTMKFLAHWIYSDPGLQSGVTESRLVDKATEYLCPKRYEDPDEARAAAVEFVRFCRGRAWVFMEVGTTAGGEGLYQFSHRTFIEFFTSDYLVRTNPSPSQLWSALHMHLSRGEWDQVSQLCFQIQNDRIEGAADDLMKLALEEALSIPEPQARLILGFLSRCLQFLVPSPATCRSVARAGLESDLREASRVWTTSRSSPSTGFHGHPFRIMRSLLQCSAEDHDPVSQSMVEVLGARIAEGSDKESLFVAELGLNLDTLLIPVGDDLPISMGSGVFAEDVSRRLIDRYPDKFRELARRDQGLASDLASEGLISMSELTDNFGSQALYVGSRLRIVEGLYRGSSADLVLSIIVHYHGATWATDPARVRNRLRQLSEIGELLGKRPLPWIREKLEEGFVGASGFDLGMPEGDEGRQVEVRSGPYSGEQLAGLFCLIAPEVERAESRKRLVARLDRIGFFSKVPMRHVLTSRFSPVPETDVQGELSSWTVTPDCLKVIESWRHAKASFYWPRQSQA